MTHQINPLIEEKLIAANISPDAGLMYLLVLYHQISTPGNFLVEVANRIHSAGIIERDYETPGRLRWIVPLYMDETTVDEAWEWVNKEYRPLFGAIRNDAIGDKQGCIKKMKKFFAENPSIRKDDVIQATKMYILKFVSEGSPPKYLQKADYFISKVLEGSKQSRLEMYLEIIKDSAANEAPQANRSLGQLIRD